VRWSPGGRHGPQVEALPEEWKDEIDRFHEPWDNIVSLDDDNDARRGGGDDDEDDGEEAVFDLDVSASSSGSDDEDGEEEEEDDEGAAGKKSVPRVNLDKKAKALKGGCSMLEYGLPDTYLPSIGFSVLLQHNHAQT
jgi:hypothetical protein